MNVERLGPLEPVAKQNKANRTAKPAKKGGADSIDISSDAKTMGEVYQAAETVKAAPDVRMDRIQEVKEKLKDPSYINDKIVDSVADSVLDLFGLS